MAKKYLLIKRILDFLIALAFLIVFFPLFIIVAIAIKLDSPGPILFLQERSGKNGKTFKIYKFRSMHTDNDAMNFNYDDKITNVGKFIRRTSIDELPQIINILKGEMSFIGPRPWMTEYSKYFSDHQRKRLDVLPGITGLAQCKGRNGIGVKEKINYDIKYVEEMSLIMDIYIIFSTVGAVLKRDGVSSNKTIIRDELEELRNQNKDSSIYIENESVNLKEFKQETLGVA